ncbi:MAG: arsenite efflux transporter metallochaperone ArsD [Gemmatimonadaceae bacterium]|jgi:hypothetical protein|nr:arsenite efflux transporter metallochaperone ArsD [Gemmatimonadaceae bacterium]
MSRSLPLQEFVPTIPATADVRLSGTVAVFDPALCCPTGVCGPGVDPALLQIARDLRWLEAQGATVVRAGLSQEPQAFVANAKVSGLMQAFGDGALPAVLVNDTVLAYGRYPSREELVAAMSSTPTTAAPDSQSDSCCAPGTGCC